MTYFLGVDIGNTKSHALICDETGKAMGCGIGGSGSPEAYGKDSFQRVLHEVARAAIDAAGLIPTDLTAAGYGIAGYDWPEDRPLIEEVIASLGLDIPYQAFNDAVPGLVAGSSRGWGVSVTSGTGVNAYGRDSQGRLAQMTGNGRAFGEIGGGAELVAHVITLISRAWSMRGPQTSLTDAFIAYAGAHSAEDLLAGIARKRYRVGSAAAPLVFECAKAGDKVAQDCVIWLGKGLGDLACGIIRQLGLEQQAFEVVLSGSIYQGSPLVLQTMRDEVQRLAPQAEFVHLTAPPVTGAVMLGMEKSGLDFISLRETIIASGDAMLNT